MESTVQLVGNCILQISIPPGDSEGEGRQKGFYLCQGARYIATPSFTSNPVLIKQSGLCQAQRVTTAHLMAYLMSSTHWNTLGGYAALERSHQLHLMPKSCGQRQ